MIGCVSTAVSSIVGTKCSHKGNKNVLLTVYSRKIRRAKQSSFLQVLSQSIEQLRNASTHLEEEDEEGSSSEQREPEVTFPPAGVIRSNTLHNTGLMRLKQEPQETERDSEHERERETGEEQKRKSDAEHRLQNMTETDV